MFSIYHQNHIKFYCFETGFCKKRKDKQSTSLFSPNKGKIIFSCIISNPIILKLESNGLVLKLIYNPFLTNKQISNAKLHGKEYLSPLSTPRIPDIS